MVTPLGPQPRHGQVETVVAGEDLTEIGRETLETFHVLLLSLDAEPRAGQCGS